MSVFKSFVGSRAKAERMNSESMVERDGYRTLKEQMEAYERAGLTLHDYRKATYQEDFKKRANLDAKPCPRYVDPIDALAVVRKRQKEIGEANYQLIKDALEAKKAAEVNSSAPAESAPTDSAPPDTTV